MGIPLSPNRPSYQESDIKTLLDNLSEKIKTEHPQYGVCEGGSFIIWPRISVYCKFEEIVRELLLIYVSDGQLVLAFRCDPFYDKIKWDKIEYDLCEPNSLDKFFRDLNKYLPKDKNKILGKPFP